MQSFAKKANDSLNFIINSIFGSKKTEAEPNTDDGRENVVKENGKIKEDNTEKSS